MKYQPDTAKALRQHAELNQFFTGGFTIKSTSSQQKDIAQKQKQLDAIAADVRKCCKCGLGETRTNAVPGEGNPDADVVFVGEAPGGDEDLQGVPFVGRAGQLLDKIIAAMGLQRGDIFIANILKCRPPGNRDPKPDEIRHCLPMLLEQLQIIQPKIIIALGAHAARTLLETDKPIGKLRGQFHDFYISPDAEPVKLMPTYHPAYLLRNYTRQAREKVWQDIQKVMEALETTD